MLYCFALKVIRQTKTNERMEVFSFLMFDDSESRHSLTAGQPQGWPLGRLILISASLPSSTAATSRHFPFGPPLKCWHVQRHIGFHYFHSYESATLDSNRAVVANQDQPPPIHTYTNTHTYTHQPAHLALHQWKFWCDHVIPLHLANEIFYAIADLLPPSLSSGREQSSS